MIKDYLGADIPKLGFGLMRLPMIEEEVDMEQTIKMVDHYMERGFTYFDTAYVYINEKSEVVAREAIVKRYPRESFQLATKMPVWMAKTYEDFQPLFDTQLERTGASYFDFYLLHALDRTRMVEMDNIGGWDFVKALKEKGLIKHIGFSFHDTAEYLDQILTKHPETEFVQLQINYADWEDDKTQSRLCYEVARKHNTPIIVMEPIKGGSLAAMTPEIQELFKKAQPDLSVASWAMRYAASLDGIVTILSGMSTLSQLEDNVSYMVDLKPLEENERQVITKVLDELAKVPTVPCTACKYCVDDCPQKINIPGIISGYNTYKIYKDFNGSKGHYNWVTESGYKASTCISCGVCESHCPQHIAIVDTLKEVAELFE